MRSEKEVVTIAVSHPNSLETKVSRRRSGPAYRRPSRRSRRQVQPVTVRDADDTRGTSVYVVYGLGTNRGCFSKLHREAYLIYLLHKWKEMISWKYARRGWYPDLLLVQHFEGKAELVRHSQSTWVSPKQTAWGISSKVQKRPHVLLLL